MYILPTLVNQKKKKEMALKNNNNEQNLHLNVEERKLGFNLFIVDISYQSTFSFINDYQIE